MDNLEYKKALILANTLIAELRYLDNTLNYQQVIRLAIYAANKMKVNSYNHYKYDDAIDILKEKLK
jgi:hypothetical protein